ncbi:MAG: DUF2911 domain-containing protein [Cytophagales bacterium]|nr:DUF2911 domain-containing protein [Cytophagales bacterium]
MKYLLILIGLLSFATSAQEFYDLDKSPMDMIYYPDHFAHDRKFAPKPEWNDEALARITYNRPARNQRELFGQLVPYGKVWRVGANEAPEIRFYKDVTIEGKKIAAGDYALVAIPKETEWIIIFSSDLNQWGVYDYTEEKDVARFTVPVKKTTKNVENLSMRMVSINDELATGKLLIGWGDTFVELPMTF